MQTRCYLYHFYIVIEHLPQELRDRFTEIRELDLQVQNATDTLDDRVKTLFGNAKRMKPNERESEYETIRKDYNKALEDADEKVQQANAMYELVDRYLRRLDQELEKFKMELEADNRGITEILEKTHSNGLLQKENRLNFSSRRDRSADRRHTTYNGGHTPAAERRSSTNSVERVIATSVNDWQTPSQSQQISNPLTAAASSSGSSQGTTLPVPVAGMQQGRRSASLKASYEALQLGGVNVGLVNEAAVARDLAGAAHSAIAASHLLPEPRESKRNKKRRKKDNSAAESAADTSTEVAGDVVEDVAEGAFSLSLSNMEDTQSLPWSSSVTATSLSLNSSGMPGRMPIDHGKLSVGRSKRHIKRKSHSPDLIVLSDVDGTAGNSPVSGLEEDSSAVTTEGPSPTLSSADSESPTPTNSSSVVRPEDAASYWHQQQGRADEHRQLLGTEGEEESSDRHSDSSDAESSSDREEDGGPIATLIDVIPLQEDCDTETEEADEALWTIQPEQLAYYVGQFLGLQPDLHGLLPGSSAKPFFEKSRLPLSELSKIWQLSDVTRDGALSLEEFCTAMHLVVLRRNGIPLPEVLPPTLVPVSAVQHLPPPHPPSVAEVVHSKSKTETKVSPKATEWTRFADSPPPPSAPPPTDSSTETAVSSPGPKPVNFDFQRVSIEQDPRIVHPVALRLTPEAQLQPHHSAVGSSASLSRPVPSRDESGPISLPSGVVTLKKEAPPPPPPRPFKGHSRSSSLDLQQLGNRSTSTQVVVNTAPPAVPPRISPNNTSPRKPGLRAKEEVDSNAAALWTRPVAETAETAEVFPNREGGAFEVYRKPGSSQVTSVSSTALPAAAIYSTSNGVGSVSPVETMKRRVEVLKKFQSQLLKELLEMEEEKSGLETHLLSVMAKE
nr:EOG090X01QX [Triops cancriformis]